MIKIRKGVFETNSGSVVWTGNDNSNSIPDEGP